MSEGGGGFCELHGPFDPPHTSCPYCTRENAQRQVFGPPEVTQPATSHALEADQDAVIRVAVSAPDSENEVLVQTIDLGLLEKADHTEIAPLDEDPSNVPENEKADSAAHQQPLGWLVVKAPPAKRGTLLAVKPDQIIGREGDIVWDDPRLSRQHARLTLEPVSSTAHGVEQPYITFHIWPFGPTNPVYVNGKAIRGATPLHENDEITLGTTQFVFKVLFD